MEVATMATIYGAPLPRRIELPPELNSVRVLTVKQGKFHTLRLLGNIVGQQTHYVEPRTVPCLTGCPHCPNHLPQRWKGYVPALVASWVESKAAFASEVERQRADWARLSES